MSSSRRSSRSTRSLRPPVWRSASMSKNSAPTSLSYVFAEPEQGAPLASAATKLPASRVSRTTEFISLNDPPDQLRDHSPSKSIEVPKNAEAGSSKEGAGAITAEENPVSTEGSSSLPINVPSGKAQQLHVSSTISNSTAINFENNPTNSNAGVPFPSLEQRPSATSSWLGSLSRSKEQRTDMQSDVTQPNQPPEDTPNTYSPPAVHLQSPTPPQPPIVPEASKSAEHQPSLPQLIPSRKPTKRSWFSSSPARAHTLSSSPTSIHPSIDEDVSTSPAKETPNNQPTPPTNSDGASHLYNSDNPEPVVDLQQPRVEASKASEHQQLLQSTPPRQSTKRSWFSSSPSPALPSSSHPSGTSIHSSIVEEGPSLSTSPTREPLNVQPAGSDDTIHPKPSEDPQPVTAATHLQPPAEILKVAEPQPSLPQSIPPQQPPKRSWFSSSPTSPARPPLSPSSPHLSGKSIPSSIDEEVPSLSTITPPSKEAPTVQPTSPAGSDGTGRPRLSSLNPSTSRFTLSIPLLGRPKIPLDQVVAHVEKKAAIEVEPPTNNGSNVQIEQITTTTTIDTTTTTTTTTEFTETASLKDNPTASDTLPETRETVASTSSWWGYIGWSASESDPPQTASTADSDTTTIKASDTPEQLPTPVMTSSEPVNIPISTDTQPSSIAATPATSNASVAETKPVSIRSAQSGGSAWYTPWAWYSSPTLPALPVAESAEKVTEAVKTQSELIKEAALARPDEVPTIDVTSPPPEPSLLSASSQESDVNPIETMISASRSGWASFFSSRSLVSKTITARGESPLRDENGMEVMSLDDDEDTTEVAKPPPPTMTKIKDVPSAPPSPQPQKSPGKKPVAPPLTISEDVRRETLKTNAKRKPSSSASSKKSGANTPVPRTPPPNLVLPTWSDTFHTAPRNVVPPPPASKLSQTMKFVSGVLFATDKAKGKARERERESDPFVNYGKELPRAWDVVDTERKDGVVEDVLKGCEKVVVIGIHGWFPGAVMRTVLGEPTGTSSKFVNMMVQALDEFQEKHNVKLKKVTKVPLEGEGTISRRVEKLYNAMLANQEWMDDLHAADAIFVATHSQGSIVSTHLLDLLIRDKHVRTARNMRGPTIVGATAEPLSAAGVHTAPALKPQKICCLALCGIHLGPLRYLSSSSLLQPYIQYFESTAARELFEFQNTESTVSKAYIAALRNVMDNGTKMLYVASLNDQVVPLYSGLFTAVSHPLILRALYIDGDAYHSSDFLSNLLVLLLRVMNSGLSDSGLLAHLSEATAGSLSGVGHSTAYEELSTYSLAVRYLFLTNDGLEQEHPELVLEPFNATTEQNDYEIPWALRDLIADQRIVHFFSREIGELRDAFREWQPKTTILRDVKRKLQPIQRLHPSITAGPSSSSKL